MLYCVVQLLDMSYVEMYCKVMLVDDMLYR